MRRKLLNTQAGLTLLELLVAMAILSIIASFAIPSFTSSIAQARLKLAVETLKTDLRDAQRKTLAAGASGNTTVTFVDGENWSYAISGNKTLTRYASEFPGGISLTSDFPGDSFSITQKTQNHQDLASESDIVLTNSQGSVTVSQSATGLISACSDDGLGYVPC